MPLVDAIPYASDATESATASKDTAMVAGAADGGGAIREDSFGTNNQVTIVGIKSCCLHMFVVCSLTICLHLTYQG